MRQDLQGLTALARRTAGTLTKTSLSIATAALALMATPGEARVIRFDVQSTLPFAGGMSFGAAGSFEELVGVATLAVDPRDPLNAGIVDLDAAPKDAQGLVEFSTPFLIIKPTDMSKGNGKIVYGLNNRGTDIEFYRFNFGAGFSNRPITAADAGDGFLERQGYTFVDAGWECDLVPNATTHNFAPTCPIATQPDGSPILGKMRIEYHDEAAGTFSLPLEGSPAFHSYEAADTNTAHSTLTIRGEESAPRVPLPSSAWAFGSCPTGQASLVPDDTHICLFAGFQPEKIYELIYPAKNPIVMGLGFATTRDVGSFLRYATEDDFGNPNPLAGSIRRSYATGSSQTGSYLRDFLYHGFNEDEAHHKVFDVVNVNIGGTTRVFISMRFADPNVFADQDFAHDYFQDAFPPMTYAVTRDPISGIEDGILKRPQTDPLVIHTDDAAEFYQLHGSFVVADGLGRPVPQPATVRLYNLASFQHFGSGAAPPFFPGVTFPGPAGMCLYPTDPTYEGFTTRALLVAWDLWADKGIEPPASRYPSARDGTLVSLDEEAEAFPAIPGVEYTPVVDEYNLLDFGRELDSTGGIMTILPPLVGPSYKVLVPTTDRDGIEIAGVHQVELLAPLGTWTGWNLRAPGHRPGNLCSLSGSFFAFATTKAERLAKGDPRRSLTERYRDHDGFVDAVAKAANGLVRERLLLKEDAERYIQAAQASNVLR
jgi:alpha/beta hydrolase family protein